MQTSHDSYTDFCTHTCPKSEPELRCRTLGSTPGKPRSRMLSSFKLSKSSKSNLSSDQLTPRRPKRSEIASCHSRMTTGAVCQMKPVQVRVSRARPEERRHHHHCLSLRKSPTLQLWSHIDLSTPNKSACNQKLAVIKKCCKMFQTAGNMGRTCWKIKTRYRKLLLPDGFCSCNRVAEGPALRSEENTHIQTVTKWKNTMIQCPWSCNSWKSYLNIMPSNRQIDSPVTKGISKRSLPRASRAGRFG